MNTKIEHINPNRVRFDSELKFDELQPLFDKSFKEMSKNVRLPGFRPGKVPTKLLEARFGREAVLDNVLNEAIPRKYEEVISDANLQTIGRPKIELKEVNDKEKITFSAEVDLKPEFELPVFNDINILIETPPTVDEFAENQLKALQRRFSVEEAVEEATADSIVVFDMYLKDLDKDLDKNTTVSRPVADEDKPVFVDHKYRIGSGDLFEIYYQMQEDEDSTAPEGLDEALIGTKKGDTKTFSSQTHNDDGTEENIEITVNVKDIFKQILPELDDEFAQLASSFDKIEELKTEIKNASVQGRENKIFKNIIHNTNQILLEKITLEAPQSLIEDEVDRMITAARESGRLPELSGEDNTSDIPETLLDYFTQDATERVKLALIKEKICDTFELASTPEEIFELISQDAMRYDTDPRHFLAEVINNNGFVYYKAMAQEQKALHYVIDNIVIKDKKDEILDKEIYAKLTTKPSKEEIAEPKDEENTHEEPDESDT